jgi:type IV secretory pathway TraG/TraD family ATPase VirD4
VEGWVYRWITGVKGLDTHGSAKWATAKELKKKGHFKSIGWMIGKLKGQKVYTGAERNVLLCAPPGQGKTMTMVAALLDIRGKEDIVVNDPAGDIEAMTRKHFADMGYRAACFNIANPPQSDVLYNPLSYIKPELHFDFERDVEALAILMQPDDVKSREPHFQEFTRMMLVAAIMTASVQDVPMTLYEVVEVLASPKRLREFFATNRGRYNSLMIEQAYEAYEAAGDKERGSFTTTMARKLKTWGTRPMRHLLQDDPNNPWSWETYYNDRKPTILYIRAGLGTEEGSVARLVLGNAINTRRRMWNKRQPFLRPLRLVIDEALTIGNCVAIQDAVNELRKAGVSTFMCWLSLQSLRDTLTHHENIINACEIVVFGGGRDMKLYREVSDMMGDKTIESGSRSESEHGESKGLNEQARKLIKPDELRAIPYTQCALTLGALNVMADKSFRKHKDKIIF